jgi:hypothetical protein
MFLPTARKRISKNSRVRAIVVVVRKTAATEPDLEARSKTSFVLDPSTHNRPSHDLSPHTTTLPVCFLSLSLLLSVCLCVSAFRFRICFSSRSILLIPLFYFRILWGIRRRSSLWELPDFIRTGIYEEILKMARDNILVTYVVVDVLFVVTGALLIIFAINTQMEIAKPFTKDNVVKDLLLGMCPLNGKTMLALYFTVEINIVTSCPWKCGSRLPNLPSLDPSDSHANNPHMAKDPRVHDGRLCDLHIGSRFGYLVRNTENATESLSHLGRATSSNPESGAASCMYQPIHPVTPDLLTSNSSTAAVI